MYTLNDFIEKKIAVSFANREERIEFLKLCQRAGLRWRGGWLPTDNFAIGNCCWVLTQECMYCFCIMGAFKCPHALNDEQIIKDAKKIL